MINKRGGKGIRQRGNSFERDVVKQLKEIGLDCGTSRNHSKDLDDKKVDIFFKTPLPLNIQCKCHNKHKNPIPVLQSMPDDGKINIVIEKVVHVGTFVTLNSKDFFTFLQTIYGEKT